VACLTYQTGAVNAERWLEIGDLMEGVLETLAQCVAVCAIEISLHLILANHSIPD